ncbi:unnamed protein product [Caenorhabditis auriculariae]|uniref:Smr domain-containing protein n=1 Tax=Caenorhabditis auriculariae TaxID=2777116 RepID=A0A8S1GYS0_9PELO|nr:unnamed protein product [Caenorhabditis auriculariae]
MSKQAEIKETHSQCYDCYASLEELRHCILDGHPVLVILRGIQGSGKSTLAKFLAGLKEGSVICSTDDLFMKNGVYEFQVERLDEFHKVNVSKVRQSLDNNVTPIIVDNTNIQFIHVKPLVTMAVRRYYEIYILEPETGWKYSAKECFRRNVHGVTKESLERALELLELEGRPPFEKLVPTKNLKIGPLTQIETEYSTQVFNILPVKAGPSASLFSLTPEDPRKKKKSVRSVGTFVDVAAIARKLASLQDPRHLEEFCEVEQVPVKLEKVELKTRASQTDFKKESTRRRDESDREEEFDPLDIFFYPFFPGEHPMILYDLYCKHQYKVAFQIVLEMGACLDEDVSWEDISTKNKNEKKLHWVKELDQFLSQTYHQDVFDEDFDDSFLDDLSFYEFDPTFSGVKAFPSLTNESPQPSSPRGETIGDKMKLARICEMFPGMNTRDVQEYFRWCDNNEDMTIDVLRDYISMNPKAQNKVIYGNQMASTSALHSTSLQDAHSEVIPILKKMKEMYQTYKTLKNAASSYGSSANKVQLTVHHIKEMAVLRGKMNDSRQRCDELIRDAHKNMVHLDLHYMTVEGAKALFLSKLRNFKEGKLHVITGYGKITGNSNIKNTVIGHLRKNNIEFHQENEGKIVITIRRR